MSTNTSRIRRSSSMKNRRQALHRVTERTESRRQWPTPAEFARRVSPATAARRRCFVRAGHATSGRAFKSPAPARTPPRTPFASPRPSFLAAAAQLFRAESRRRHSQRQSPSSVLLHSNCSTSTPTSHRLHPRSSIALGKPPQRAHARRSSATTLRRRGQA